MAFNSIAFLVSVIMFSVFSAGYGLSSNYYQKTCPDVESIVTYAVKNAVAKDKTVPAALLRLHFHDCFIRVYRKFLPLLNLFFWDLYTLDLILL